MELFEIWRSAWEQGLSRLARVTKAPWGITATYWCKTSLSPSFVSTGFLGANKPQFLQSGKHDRMENGRQLRAVCVDKIQHFEGTLGEPNDIPNSLVLAEGD